MQERVVFRCSVGTGGGWSRYRGRIGVGLERVAGRRGEGALGGVLGVAFDFTSEGFVGGRVEGHTWFSLVREMALARPWGALFWGGTAE